MTISCTHSSNESKYVNVIMNTNCFKGDWIQVTWILFFINPIYNFTCLSVHLSRSWKLSPRTRGPKNYSGPRVLTSVSAHQLPKTDVVDAAISKLPLLSFLYLQLSNHLAIYVEVLKIVPSNSRSQKLFRTSSSYVRFRTTTVGNGRRRCCNLQAPSTFFLYL
jgi:hypothetical protein